MFGAVFIGVTGPRPSTNRAGNPHLRKSGALRLRYRLASPYSYIHDARPSRWPAGMSNACYVCSETDCGRGYDQVDRAFHRGGAAQHTRSHMVRTRSKDKAIFDRCSLHWVFSRVWRIFLGLRGPRHFVFSRRLLGCRSRFTFGCPDEETGFPSVSRMLGPLESPFRCFRVMGSCRVYGFAVRVDRFKRPPRPNMPWPAQGNPDSSTYCALHPFPMRISVPPVMKPAVRRQK